MFTFLPEQTRIHKWHSALFKSFVVSFSVVCSQDPVCSAALQSLSGSKLGSFCIGNIVTIQKTIVLYKVDKNKGHVAAHQPHLPPLWTQFLYVAWSVYFKKKHSSSNSWLSKYRTWWKTGDEGIHTLDAIALDNCQNRTRDSSLKEITVVKFSGISWLDSGFSKEFLAVR